MSDNPPRPTACGAYLYADFNMSKEYTCFKCGRVSIPYMIWIKGNLCLPFCSFDCSMVVYIQRDMQPRRSMVFQGEKGVRNLYLVPKRSVNSEILKNGEGDIEMKISRDAYLRDKILESGVDIEKNQIPNLSTWDGFGFLFNWAHKQSWWDEFAVVEYPWGDEVGSIPPKWVDPDVFADELYKFL